MKFMSATQTTIRTPKGVPTGGEYATHNRPEATVVLSGKTKIEKVYPAKPANGLTDVEILEHAVRLARSASFNKGISREDAEDIAQEAVLQVLKTKKDNGNLPVQGGYIRVVTRGLVSKRMDTHTRHEDSEAFKKWKFEVEFMENAEGRHLTTEELDSIAKDIRDNWKNDRHRPSVGFQHETKVIAMDAVGAGFAGNIAHIVNADADGSEIGHDLADALAKGEIAKETAKRQLWNVLAEDNGASHAVANSLTEREVKAAAKDVGADRAVEVARNFANGTTTTAEENALFAPFGMNLTDSAKRRIARTIAARPEVGHRLWKSALDFANKKYAA